MFLIVVIYAAFISLGLPDGVFGVAMPSIRSEFGLSLEVVGTASVIVMFFSAISSMMAGRLIRKYGTAKLTVFSTFATAIALAGYAISPSYWIMLLFAIPLGLGQGGVDTGLNNYVANHYSSRHMSWLHCFWGIGATLGPFFMVAALESNRTWRIGYGHLAMIQIAVALLLWGSIKLWKESRNHEETPMAKKKLPGRALLTVSLFLVYPGAESSIGLWANSMLMESRGIDAKTAGIWISYYYMSLMIGRLVTGIVVNKLGNKMVVRIGMIVSILGTTLLFFQDMPRAVMMVSVMMIGFGLAPIYPCMIHETPKRFKKEISAVLIGYQVGAACFGGIFIILFSGFIFGKLGLELLIPSVGLILIYMFFVSEYLNRKIHTDF